MIVKKSEAIKHLRTLMFSMQRLRGFAEETGIVEKEGNHERLSLSENFAAELWPWVWGDKSLLPILDKLIDKYDTTGELEPMDFHNIITVATQLEPILLGGGAEFHDSTFPRQAEIQWLFGWDPED
jgi:hypothetical protein